MRGVTHSASALLFFLALAAIRTWPLLANFQTHIPSDPYEPLLMTWVRPLLMRGVMVPAWRDGPPTRLHSLPLAGLSPGLYTVHLLFAKATRNQIVAEARARFHVEP